MADMYCIISGLFKTTKKKMTARLFKEMVAIDVSRQQCNGLTYAQNSTNYKINWNTKL